jgi:hypothetical protein
MLLPVEIWSAISALGSVAAAVATCFAAFGAMRAAASASHQAKLLQGQLVSAQNVLKVEVHCRFQSEVRSIQRSFPPEVNLTNWNPTDLDRRNVRLYWYLVFDEWLTCKKTNAGLDQLWDWYAVGVRSAFRNRIFGEEARKLFSGRTAFFGFRDEFYSELNTAS